MIIYKSIYKYYSENTNEILRLIDLKYSADPKVSLLTE